VLGTLLFYRGSFEEEEIVFLLRLVKDVSSPVLLDIGANIGWHAVRWATSRPDICIFAFEPSRNTAELLRRNVIVNGVEAQIRHIPSAVSDTIGALEFHECEDSGYSSLKDTKRKKVIATTTVPVTTVDSFVKDERLSHVAAIKIDVEGLETEVLRGATDTLSRWSPEMLVEIYGGQASNPNPDKTIRLMQSLGYRAFVWKNKKLLPFESHSDRYFNYWFTKRQNPPTSLG
jgi:FkbM family methyltransferase